MFGINPFLHTHHELEEMASKYREWYQTSESPSIENVPDELKLAFQIHHNLSNESVSRANLFSELTGTNPDEAIITVLHARSILIPIESFNGSTIYSSTIYRGKTQVNTGTAFERKITDFVNRIQTGIEMIPGQRHGDYKYDKDILINGEYKLSAELSFQVTTNSVIERKSHLEIPANLNVVMIFGGLGWIERINALERIASTSSRYSDCFGPSEEELNRLREYILSLI